MSYRQNKNNIFNIKRKEQERRRQRRRQQLLNDHRAIEDGITLDDHRRRPQRRRITMSKKDYEKMEKTTTVFSNPLGSRHHGELEKTSTNSHDVAFSEGHRELEKTTTSSHDSYGFETIGDRVRNRRESGRKTQSPQNVPPIPPMDPPVSPSRSTPMSLPEETPFNSPPIVPPIEPPNDAQMMEEPLTDGEVVALLEEINHEEDYTPLDILTLDRVPPTENEIQLLQIARENTTDDEIEFTVIRKRDFGLENTAQAWRGMLGETYRISQLIKEYGLIPLVELVFGGRTRRFIVNLENIEPQEFLNQCVGFDVGIEEFWRSYDDRENELNIPPGKLVNEIIITILKPPQRQRIEGALFNYYLVEHWAPLEHILKKYQIYSKEDIVQIENCFIHCLENSHTLTKTEMDKIRTKLKGNTVTKKTMKRIAEEFHLNIILRYYNGEKIVTNNIKHGERIIKIFLIRWENNFHYVPDEKVPLTTYFIHHYEEIVNYCNENGKDIEKFFNVTKKEGEIYKHSLQNYIPIYKCLKELREVGAIKEIVKYNQT
ncbi:hypothetical protein CL6EHI_041780 [Entamoeba histolytica]|uniref:Uncharacterized protein n=1 Tax=Entamoeba histolytica TaxID=5759 RepID=A0A175K0J2_ENTHI|nr:hypothetical protein CL6EHI_041780 [Entamoeba histolytica]